MRIWVVVLVLGACGGSKPATPPPVSNVAPVPPKPEPTPEAAFVPAACVDGDGACFIRNYAGLAGEMCKCKEHDAACAQQANDQLTKWSIEEAKRTTKERQPYPDTIKQATQIMSRYTECMTKAMTPAADPCAGSSAPPTP
jgi:hypothetical protein